MGFLEDFGVDQRKRCEFGASRDGWNTQKCIHKTLHITPAMAAGISDHVWSYEEIAALAE
jgi:hypothetical protein